MRRLTSFALALVFALGFPAYSTSQTAVTGARVELRISGPKLIHLGQKLNFKVTLTNRSSQPIALRFPHFYFDDSTLLDWRLTDAGGRLLPPHEYPQFVICPVVGPVTDLMITILQPGESMEYEAGDPSDTFAFKGKGFYRASLHYVLDPSIKAMVQQIRSPDEKPGLYTPAQKVQMLEKMPRIDVTSNEWLMYLTD